MFFFNGIQKHPVPDMEQPCTLKHLLFGGIPLACALLLSGCSDTGHFMGTSLQNSAGSTVPNSGTNAAQTASKSAAQISDTGFCLDTVITITLNGTDDETLLEDAFTLITNYENMLSRTKEGSDIWNINHSGGKPTQVSAETMDLIETALKYSKLSDGAFDITIAPVVSLWNFQDGSGTIPNSDVLARALSHVGYEKIQTGKTSVTLSDPEAAIDLGGIAKGYIADRVKDFLEEKGIESGLLNLGGNVLVIGAKPDGTKWNIGIRKPFGESSDLITTVRCNDLSIVTSGSYERYFEKNGTIFHHILDPKNGYPADNGLTSVTILSGNSTDGDALSTACFILGLEDGMKLAESLDGIEALFITEDQKLHYTSGFPESKE